MRNSYQADVLPQSAQRHAHSLNNTISDTSYTHPSSDHTLTNGPACSRTLPTIQFLCNDATLEGEGPRKRPRLSEGHSVQPVTWQQEQSGRNGASRSPENTSTGTLMYHAHRDHVPTSVIEVERSQVPSGIRQYASAHQVTQCDQQSTRLQGAMSMGISSSYKTRVVTTPNEVCFGLIERIPLTLVEQSPPLTRFKGQFTIDCRLHGDDGLIMQEINGVQVPLGYVVGSWLKILLLLNQEESVTLEIRCRLSSAGGTQVSPANKTVVNMMTANLEVIVYGPLDAMDDINDFLDESGVFLQDPKGCKKNVPYHNPQRLSSLTGPSTMTFQLDKQPPTTRREQLRTTQDYLDDLVFRTNIPSAQTPPSLKTDMFDHQKRALSFMQERERGWNLDSSVNDIWAFKAIHGSPVYVNQLTQEIQSEPPTSFRGGLLADGMGLGKTLSMISLIASGLDDNHPSSRTRCTLVIVPPNLLATWQWQFSQHTYPDKLMMGVHHGDQRLLTISDIAKYDVVLTSYHTLAYEWKRHSHKSSVLFSHDWHRVVLDEAHLIRDKKSQMSQAICAIQAECRWAVTGTPIQNHVTDFIGLLQFLRPHPYHRQQKFDEDIIQLWKVDAEAAIARFKQLITAITLRRTNGTIDLPPRMDEVFHVQFSASERRFYNDVEEQARNVIDRPTLLGDSPGAASRNALRALTHLRSICNHGVQVNPLKFEIEAFPYQDQSELFQCTGCLARSFDQNSMPTTPSSDLDYASPASVATPEPSMDCPSCIRGSSTMDLGLLRHLDPPSSSYRNSSQEINSREIRTCGDLPQNEPECMPAKIAALVQDLLKTKSSKSVVFSFWSTTLTLIASALDAHQLSYVRFDGTISGKDREAALSKFRRDSTIQVILITISCGAVGLDLTVADRAYLLEPQWNPTVEDQAMARIHRLGQKKPVTTVRFVVDDTIEQRVIELQKRKRNFADLLLSSKSKSTAGSKYGQYQYLRSLLS